MPAPPSSSTCARDEQRNRGEKMRERKERRRCGKMRERKERRRCGFD
jgi:predicted phage gp36 major capsid-like protein